MNPQDQRQTPHPGQVYGQQPPQAPPPPAPGEVMHSPQQYVYVTRPHEPLQPQLSDEQRHRHEESKRKYPTLNLSEGEFVLSSLKRHPIGLIQIWGVSAVIIGLLVITAFFLSGAGGAEAGLGEGLSLYILAIPAGLLALLVLVFTYIATSIYNANEFILTNESVIQKIQHSLFSKKEQTVSLANIEDASYTQHGVLPHMLNYGMIRLSTEGDETTYRFNYASNPKHYVAILNNAVEAFKNGRPVTGED